MTNKKKLDPMADTGLPECSITALEEFLLGRVYQDFLAELDRWDEDLKARLLDEEQQFSGRQYDLFRGGRKFLAYARDLFPFMYELKKAEVESMEAKDGK